MNQWPLSSCPLLLSNSLLTGLSAFPTPPPQLPDPFSLHPHPVPHLKLSYPLFSSIWLKHLPHSRSPAIPFLQAKPPSFLFTSFLPTFPLSLHSFPFHLFCPHSQTEQGLTPAHPKGVSHIVGFQEAHLRTPFPHLHTTHIQTRPGHPCWN